MAEEEEEEHLALREQHDKVVQFVDNSATQGSSRGNVERGRDEREREGKYYIVAYF